ncbi:MAG: hypothetical protein ABSG56_22990 [Bryobacteraceae bacterium]|jgi:hypothetical protein
MTTNRRFSIAPLLFSAACITTSFSLTVSLRAESFSLEASPSTVYVNRDEKATSTITVHPSGAFNGSVTLLVSRLPPGVSASFDPDSTTSASKLVFVATKVADTGLFSITVTGKSGSLTQSATITLVVSAATTALEQWSICSRQATCLDGTTFDVVQNFSDWFTSQNYPRFKGTPTNAPGKTHAVDNATQGRSFACVYTTGTSRAIMSVGQALQSARC